MDTTKEIKQSRRPWQIKAEEAEREYTRNGGTKPLLAACPGAGKTVYGVHRGCRFFNEEGGQLIIVLAPTVNIKMIWIEEFKAANFVVTGDVLNSIIRDRLQFNEDIKTDYEVIVITYAQLAASNGLFEHYCERYETLIIGDEIHHADDDESYGLSLTKLADKARSRLALSGTPFTTGGGSLAMCDTEIAIDPEDNKPKRFSKTFHEYTYGDAMVDSVCRMVEFGITFGKALTTYESLLTGETKKRLVDLALKRRTDSLRPLLHPDGDFLPTMVDTAIAKFDAIKHHDNRAAMLIVAKDRDDAALILQMVDEKCGARYATQMILHDTEKAHDRIKALSKDKTDIVVTVRMLAEGVDVKRFRVGVYASDYLTDLFFIQFVGRFIRWEDRLEANQFAVLVFPGHIKLIEYAEAIEKMKAAAILRLGTGGDGPWEPSTMIQTDNETEFTDQILMARGAILENDDFSLVKNHCTRYPDDNGILADSVLARILRRAKSENPFSSQDTADDTSSAPERDDHKLWRKNNEKIASLVVSLLKKNGSQIDDSDLHARVRAKANKTVGIRKIDALVSLETLQQRHAFLRQWAGALLKGAEPESFDADDN